MTPGTLNIECPQGTTWTATWTWKVDGTAVNLTGYSAYMQVRPTYSSAAALIDIDSTSEIVLGGAAGTITVTIPASVTAAVPAGNYVWDIELVSGGGIVTRLLNGSWKHTAEVTRV